MHVQVIVQPSAPQHGLCSLLIRSMQHSLAEESVLIHHAYSNHNADDTKCTVCAQAVIYDVIWVVPRHARFSEQWQDMVPPAEAWPTHGATPLAPRPV